QVRTLFFGSHNSHPSQPISALTVSSAHSILVPLAMRLFLWPGPPDGRRRRGAARCQRLLQQPPHLHAERLREFFEHAQRGIVARGFEPREIRAADPSRRREPLLRHPAPFTEPFDPNSHAFSQSHLVPYVVQPSSG